MTLKGGSRDFFSSRSPYVLSYRWINSDQIPHDNPRVGGRVRKGSGTLSSQGSGSRAPHFWGSQSHAYAHTLLKRRTTKFGALTSGGYSHKNLGRYSPKPV